MQDLAVGFQSLLVDASQQRQTQLNGGHIPELVYVAVTSDGRGEQASFELVDGVAHIFIWWPVDGDGKGHPEIVGSEPTETANDVPDSPLPPYAGLGRPHSRVLSAGSRLPPPSTSVHDLQPDDPLRH